MSTGDDKRYVGMEPVLQAINKSYISLAEDNVKRNNPILKQLIEGVLLPRMRQQDELFDLMFTNTFYGGSYYDGLKVGQPDEYDLDLLLSLPKVASPQFLVSDTAGYVYVQLQDIERLWKQPEGSKYRSLLKLMDKENFILTIKFRSWIEGIINKVLNGFEKEAKLAYVDIEQNDAPNRFYISLVKSGPALTLKISGDITDKKVVMDVDIVPSFKCTTWPESDNYRQNPCPKKTDFFVVPKGPANNAEKYWRLSFQDQERELINGSNKLKPTIRLLKRFRDFQKHDVVASYYIKTIFLLSFDNAEIGKCWNSATLSCCFMKGLEMYESYLRQSSIPFYWNKENNLLGALKPDTCMNIANKIKKIHRHIHNTVEADPFVVAQYLLQPDEIESLKKSVNLGAKIEKKAAGLQLLHSISNSSMDFSITNSMDSLNLDILQNSFDVVDASQPPKSQLKNDGDEQQHGTLNAILSELRSINKRLTKIEEKADRIERRLERIERQYKNDPLLLGSFADLTI